MKVIVKNFLPIQIFFAILSWNTFHNFLSPNTDLEQLGKLPITIYLPEEYKASPQVWSTIQNDNESVYLKTTSILYEYSGISQKFFQKSLFVYLRNFQYLVYFGKQYLFKLEKYFKLPLNQIFYVH